MSDVEDLAEGVENDPEQPEVAKLKDEGVVQLDAAEKRFEDLRARVVTLVSDMRDLGSGVEAMESAVNTAGKKVKTLSVKKAIRPGSADEKVIKLEKMIRFLVGGMPSRKEQFNELFPPEKSEE